MNAATIIRTPVTLVTAPATVSEVKTMSIEPWKRLTARMLPRVLLKIHVRSTLPVARLASHPSIMSPFIAEYPGR